MELFAKLDMEFVTLNQYIDKERGHRMAGAAVKKQQTLMAVSGMPKNKKIPTPCKLYFHWRVKTMAGDLDNLSFCKKFVIDGMVLIGAIPDDSKKHINEFRDTFEVNKKVGVDIFFEKNEKKLLTIDK